MIPLRDNIPASRTPIVRNALMGICAAVFLLQLGDGRGELVYRLGMVPSRVNGGSSLADAYVPDWLTLLTCTFLHGGFLHFAGNMLFLWIFGDNVEDRFGRIPFLLFYLGCGVAASAAHLLSNPMSRIPTIGASGAIAGVMGAYLLLYPRSKVSMLFIFGFFVDVIVLPAPFFLGYWFLLQLIHGSIDRGHGGGVAWWAHIGGFVVGAAVAAALRASEKLRPEPKSIVLTRRRVVSSPWRRRL